MGVTSIVQVIRVAEDETVTERRPRTLGPLTRAARAGALSGALLAVLIAGSLWLFSTPPSGIDADAFAAGLDHMAAQEN